MWYFSLWETWYLHDDRLHNITSHFSVLVAVSLCLGGGAVSGCTRGRGPAGWLDSVAPRVSLSSERLVTISWRQDMLLSDPQCRHRWQITVEKQGEEREVCSGTTSPRWVATQWEPVRVSQYLHASQSSGKMIISARWTSVSANTVASSSHSPWESWPSKTLADSGSPLLANLSSSSSVEDCPQWPQSWLRHSRVTVLATNLSGDSSHCSIELILLTTGPSN